MIRRRCSSSFPWKPAGSIEEPRFSLGRAHKTHPACPQCLGFRGLGFRSLGSCACAATSPSEPESFKPSSSNSAPPSGRMIWASECEVLASRGLGCTRLHGVLALGCLVYCSGVHYGISSSMQPRRIILAIRIHSTPNPKP